MELNKNVSRRNFLAASAATAAGLGLAGCSLSSGSSSTTSSSSSSTGADQSILDNKDTIQLTIFSQTANWSGAQAGWGAQLLKDKFNVEVTIIPDTSGTFETRMENGDLGDIVVFGANGDQYKNAVSQGLLFDWESEDLVKNYGTDIENYFPDALESNRELNSDNAIHGIGNNIASESGEHDLFFYNWGIRWDLYQQLGYPEVKDWDGLVDVLGKMVEKNPTGDTGEKCYGVSIWPDWDGDMVMYVKALASGYYGYDELGMGLYDSSDGSFHGALEDDGPYLKALKFCNKLYRAGLLDPDSMTQTYDTMISKVQNGDVMFSVFDYAGSVAFNTSAHEAKNQFMAPLVPTEASDIVYGLGTFGNSRIWAIGAKTLYPEKCMQILNWLCTPDGAMDIWYGIQGLMWDYDKSKKTYFTDLGKSCHDNQTYDLSSTQWTSADSGETYTLIGTFNDGMFQANNTTWAPGASNPNSDGERFSCVTWASQEGDATCDAQKDWRSKTGVETEQDYLDTTNYTTIPATNYSASAKDSELDLKWNQVKAEICTGSWKAMYADDDASFTSLVSDMTTTCKGYGYDDCVAWCEGEAKTRFGLQK